MTSMNLHGGEGRSDPVGLDKAASGRAGVRAAMDRIEDAIAAPTRDAERWLANVRDALEGLGSALATHIEGVEGPGGMFEEVLGIAPHLAPAVEDLTREHRELRASLSRVLEAVEAGEPAMTRRRGVALLGRIAMHRQSSGDLVLDAYNVDIGGRG